MARKKRLGLGATTAAPLLIKRRGNLRQQGWDDFGFSNREILYLLGVPKKSPAWVDWFWRNRVCAKLHTTLAQTMRELGMDPLDKEDRRIAVRALWDTIKERIYPKDDNARETISFQREVVKELLQDIFEHERKPTNDTGQQTTQHPGGS